MPALPMSFGVEELAANWNPTGEEGTFFKIEPLKPGQFRMTELRQVTGAKPMDGSKVFVMFDNVDPGEVWQDAVRLQSD